jgi:hypothetical protein
MRCPIISSVEKQTAVKKITNPTNRNPRISVGNCFHQELILPAVLVLPPLKSLKSAKKVNKMSNPCTKENKILSPVM